MKKVVTPKKTVRAIVPGPVPPKLDAKELAYLICDSVYATCGCRDRRRGQVCGTMEYAANEAVNFVLETKKATLP